MSKMNPNEWIIKGEVGVSSQTIWAVMMGVEKVTRQCDDFNYDIPHDMDDFSRCIKLMNLFPEWYDRINEVSHIFPKWIPIIREWGKLDSFYNTIVGMKVSGDDRQPKQSRKYKEYNKKLTEAWEFIHKLNDEAMFLDGWMCEYNLSSWTQCKDKTEQINKQISNCAVCSKKCEFEVKV